VDFTDTHEAATKRLGWIIRELPGATYNTNHEECARHAAEALRHPRSLDDPRRLRTGINIGVEADGQRVSVVRVDPTPEAQELARKVVWPKDAYCVRGSESGIRWLLFAGCPATPAEGADLVPGLRLLGRTEVAPLPPSYLSRFERMFWAGPSPFSGPVDPHPALPLPAFPMELLTLLPKPEGKRKGSKP
jgi:hypothetical protein